MKGIQMEEVLRYLHVKCPDLNHQGLMECCLTSWLQRQEGLIQRLRIFVDTSYASQCMSRKGLKTEYSSWKTFQDLQTCKKGFTL